MIVMMLFFIYRLGLERHLSMLQLQLKLQKGVFELVFYVIQSICKRKFLGISPGFQREVPQNLFLVYLFMIVLVLVERRIIGLAKRKRKIV